MGIVAVAARRHAGGGPPTEAITLTWRRTNSVTNSGNRLY